MAWDEVSRRRTCLSRKLDRVVCFSETPLEHVWMMCEEIEGRSNGFSPYGVAFTKAWARTRGINPVWYLDITPGHDWLTGPITEMVYLAETGHAMAWSAETQKYGPVVAAESPIARITPFIEQMGKPGDRLKEWWWEREWRKVGNLSFSPIEVVGVLAPEQDHENLKSAVHRSDLLKFIDPRWGLERMIASLADVPAQYLGPFPR